MATWQDVVRLAAELPGLTATGEEPARAIVCQKQTLAWERPYTKADIKRETLAGKEVYAGSILAVHTPDVETAIAYTQMEPAKYFQTEHFKNYPAVLCRLELLYDEDLRELLFEAKMARVHDRGLG